jgi:hypothetical protein
MSFRDFSGKSYGDAFGGCHGCFPAVAGIRDQHPTQLHPTLPPPTLQPQSFRAFGTVQSYGASAPGHVDAAGRSLRMLTVGFEPSTGSLTLAQRAWLLTALGMTYYTERFVANDAEALQNLAKRAAMAQAAISRLPSGTAGVYLNTFDILPSGRPGSWHKSMRVSRPTVTYSGAGGYGGTSGYGATAVSAAIQGNGGYVYQRMSDGTIAVTSPTGSKSTAYVGSAAWKAIDKELNLVGVVAPGTQSSQSQSQSQSTGGSKVDVNAIAGAVGSFLSSFGAGKAQAATPTYAPAQTYMPPTPAPASTSWVGPAVAVGGLGVIGVLVYMLTREA